MTEVLLYLYGMITGLALAGTIMYIGHLISKAFNHGWAGSPPKTVDAIKASLDKTERPY